VPPTSKVPHDPARLDDLPAGAAEGCSMVLEVLRRRRAVDLRAVHGLFGLPHGCPAHYVSALTAVQQAAASTRIS
jgi:hypothetical protein